MTTVYDVPADALIKELAERLKVNEHISPPDWVIYARSGVGKELLLEEGWWFTRCASLLRRIYIDGPVGVARLRTYYGHRQRRGVKKERSVKGSGSIIREALRQLENAGYIKKIGEGRMISPKGQSLLDNTAYNVKIDILPKIQGLEKY
jgi:small subunit ribosomal protein S19e